MKAFNCACGHRVFFENTSCIACGRVVGFDPTRLTMLSADPSSSIFFDPVGRQFSKCGNWFEHDVCNWLIPATDARTLCEACRLNSTVPNLDAPDTLLLWSRLEAAKRRLLYGLMTLGLVVAPEDLKFQFLQDQRTNPAVNEPHVFTGYANGEITINVAEADDVYRESTRVAFGEPYRTLLGHFRHESGHFFWPRLITGEIVTAFQALFGDESADYNAVLDTYHASGAPANWQDEYVSAYAAAHPHEDWAETWAHYLHIMDTLETAASNGMQSATSTAPWLDRWAKLSIALNELNRSVGVADAYPFVLAPLVCEKLTFIHRRVASARSNT